MRPFFISIRGALTQSQPPVLCYGKSIEKRRFGIRRPLVGGHCRVCRGFTRTADMALKSGSNTQVIPCPAVLFYYADAGDRNEFFNL